MKLYRVVDMLLRKDDTREEGFRIGSHGTIGGVVTSIETCKEIIKKERDIFLRSERYGKIEILKDTDLEFQGKLIEKEDRVSVYTIKATEIEVSI